MSFRRKQQFKKADSQGAPAAAASLWAVPVQASSPYADDLQANGFSEDRHASFRQHKTVNLKLDLQLAEVLERQASRERDEKEEEVRQAAKRLEELKQEAVLAICKDRKAKNGKPKMQWAFEKFLDKEAAKAKLEEWLETVRKLTDQDASMKKIFLEIF